MKMGHRVFAIMTFMLSSAVALLLYRFTGRVVALPCLDKSIVVAPETLTAYLIASYNGGNGIEL